MGGLFARVEAQWAKQMASGGTGGAPFLSSPANGASASATSSAAGAPIGASEYGGGGSGSGAHGSSATGRGTHGAPVGSARARSDGATSAAGAKPRTIPFR